MHLRSDGDSKFVPDRIAVLKDEDFISERCQASDDRTAYIRHPMFLKAIPDTYMNPIVNTARQAVLLLRASCKLLIIRKGKA